MTNEELKKKIVEVLNTLQDYGYKSYMVNNLMTGEIKMDSHQVVNNRIADALIAVGLKFDTVISHTATFDLMQQERINELEAENAEFKEKAQKLDEQLKAISDRTAKFPSLEQIEKRFLDWAIPFLKANVTSCKEEWFGIEWIAKAIWEFIKNGFENAIAVDETNAALRERLEKAVELPCKRKRLLWGDKDKETLLCPDCLTDLMGGIGDETFVVQCPNCGCFVDCMVEPIPFTEAAEARLKELQGGEE